MSIWVSFVPQTFFRFFFRIRIRIMTRIRISLWNSLETVIFYILNIPTKFGAVPQSFCRNQNPVQDQDQDHDFTLDFNTRPTFYTQKTPTKFCLDPLIPSKVIVSTAKVHVQTDRRNFFLLLVLSSKTYKTWTFVKRREIFFFHSCDYNTFSFYILRMRWESKNRCENLIILKTYELKLLLRRFSSY